MPERRTTMGAQDRLLLLLALIPYLIDHERVSVTEAAAHFGVSPERVRQAVRLIAVSGVPGQTRQYLPGDLFDIAWDDFEENDRIVITNLVAIDDAPRFSAREAAALIAGLQYMQALPEFADRAALGKLMAKLTRGASGAPASVAVAAAGADTTLNTVRGAISAGERIEFDYLNARGRSQRRTVDPLRLESVDQDWYLRAWCHLRRAVRTFRLDRMDRVTTTGEPVTDHGDRIEIPEALFEPSPDDLVVEVEVAPGRLPLVSAYLDPESAAQTRADGRTRARIRVAHLPGLVRLVAGMPGGIRVLAPREARDAVAAWARSGIDRNRIETSSTTAPDRTL